MLTHSLTHSRAELYLLLSRCLGHAFVWHVLCLFIGFIITSCCTFLRVHARLYLILRLYSSLTWRRQRRSGGDVRKYFSLSKWKISKVAHQNGRNAVGSVWIVDLTKVLNAINHTLTHAYSSKYIVQLLLLARLFISYFHSRNRLSRQRNRSILFIKSQQHRIDIV